MTRCCGQSGAVCTGQQPQVPGDVPGNGYVSHTDRDRLLSDPAQLHCRGPRRAGRVVAMPTAPGVIGAMFTPGRSPGPVPRPGVGDAPGRGSGTRLVPLPANDADQAPCCRLTSTGRQHGRPFPSGHDVLRAEVVASIRVGLPVQVSRARGSGRQGRNSAPGRDWKTILVTPAASKTATCCAWIWRSTTAHLPPPSHPGRAPGAPACKCHYRGDGPRRTLTQDEHRPRLPRFGERGWAVFACPAQLSTPSSGCGSARRWNPYTVAPLRSTVRSSVQPCTSV